MAAANPDILVRRGIEPGLVGTILASAAIHAAALVVLVTIPGRFLSTPPKLESYTVDLVAPDALGGTNLAPGAKARNPVSPQPAADPKPVAEQVPSKPLAPPEAAPGPPVGPPPPKVAEPAKPVEPPKPVVPPKPVEAAKPEERALKPAAQPMLPVAAKPPDAEPVAPPKPPAADAGLSEVKPVAKPAEPVKPVPKAEPVKPAPAVANPAPVNPSPAEAQKKSGEPPNADAAAKAARQRDEEIADAVQRRAAQVHGGSAHARPPDADKQIAAAVQRRAEQMGQGAGNAPAATGGPASIGPGSGAGGTPADLQYILYQGRMEERIKAAWAWAGADKTLLAVIQFNLTPDGEIRNVRTIAPSGDRQYDASCERAVRAVNPLEAVPEKYREAFATVEMTFKPSDLVQ